MLGCDWRYSRLFAFICGLFRISFLLSGARLMPAPASGEAPPRTVYSVSDLTEILSGLLQDSLPNLWVQGEISNLAKPASGHWYFTLKDERAQLRCAMFRNPNSHVRP